jgi:RecA-family ATPase
MTDHWRAEITVFQKQGGVLSKRISLDASGKVCSDGSACLMTRGTARRVVISDIRAYAGLVNACGSHEALALGRLRADLASPVRVVTAAKLNGGGDPATIARTKEFLTFEPGTGGLVLLDFDPKGMCDAVKQRFEECGGLFPALCSVLPSLETAATVERSSTSSGLRHSQTGEVFGHSGGVHLVIPVVDAADIPRFLSDLHDRCWLAGLGWGLVSAAGSFLARAIVDKSCGSPERLVFEGAPIVEPPLVQDGREAKIHDGTTLDTRRCPPLTDDERAQLHERLVAEERRLLPERQAARSAWSLKHIQRLIARGIPEPDARSQVDRWIDHRELTGAFALPFDRDDLAGKTVADVLADPDRFVDQTLADPHEGPSYGRGKAILYWRTDGSLFIRSFAHGGMTYELLKEAPSPSLPYIDLALDPIPPRDWLVLDRIPMRNVSMLSGEGAMGKSILLMQLAGAAVLGRDWVGTLPEPGPVLFLSAEEDDLELCRRMEAVAQHFGATRQDMIDAGLGVLSFAGLDALLGVPDRAGVIKPTPLFEALKRDAIQQRPKLIVVDPVADVFAGKEMDRAQTRQFITLLRGLAMEVGAAVVISAHPSLTGIKTDTGLSGSTAWHNSVRARMYLKAAGDDTDLRVMECKKSNYSRLGETVVLRWKDGVYAVEPGVGTLQRLAAEQKISELFMTLLRRSADQGRNVSDKPGTSYAPAKFAKSPEAIDAKITSKDFAEAMERLFTAGKIRVVTEGPRSHPRTRLAATNTASTDPSTDLPPPSPDSAEGVCVPPPYNPPAGGSRQEGRWKPPPPAPTGEAEGVARSVEQRPLPVEDSGGARRRWLGKVNKGQERPDPLNTRVGLSSNKERL